MSSTAFNQITTWVFDLDNTLYPAGSCLFPQIERKMTAWVMRNLGLDEPGANRLRHEYWQQYGTTLAGLMANHDIDPSEFLADVHDIDFSGLSRDHGLARRIADLPGRRIIFTNADTVYATRVLERRGLSGLFDALYGIEEAGYLPKPRREAFDRIGGIDGFDPGQGAMFEDDPRNLLEPHRMGMRTILIAPEPVAQDHIHHHHEDLRLFLDHLARG